MDVLFIAGTGSRKIRLTKERWRHITREHPEVTDIEELKAAVQKPLTVTPSVYDPENVAWHYRYNKEKKRYLMVAVKYLNGDGFIITCHYTRKIK